MSKDTVSRITDKVLAEMAEWMARPLEKVYAAIFVDAIYVKVRLELWGNPYPAIGRLGPNAWEQFTPSWDDDVEIRKVLSSTNAIESMNARFRRAVNVRGHSPTEQAALKCLYLVARSLDPKGTGRTRWTMRWKPALNAFAVTFADRMPQAQDG